MKTWKKVAIGIAVLAVLAILVGITVRQSGKNVATVQTGKAQHQDLSSVVSARAKSAEDVCQHRANAFGKIMHLPLAGMLIGVHVATTAVFQLSRK